ncbi:class I SAM-dependent methyltransferase [Actinomadura sp. KC345]|uniref:class I SAM-dependent methyltransferase n=1 Tax=Actinomadura sp. KC345 TaxID=2530371 RepID=UPI00104D8362|nr:class I SAM-dependent methyltransferase [Actinomadura sp. KC345]TDC55777.1 class I SAM-dependent methyltransferase [Actinomadura sp. KC345]
MPTIPSERPSEREPHQAREVAESFGADPGRYDRTRPRYPDDLVERVVEGSPGRDVLDVGCGTGILARQLQAAGCRVLGVEVDERMAAWARERGLDVEVAPFEDWDPAGRTFDAVVAGQAWHWVDPVAGAVRAAQALRSGGRLALFWNALRPPAELAEPVSAVYRRVVPDSPVPNWAPAETDAYSVMCTRASDGIREAGGFEDPERWQVSWERVYTRDEWLELVPTFGGHSRFPAAALRELLDGIGAVVDAAGGRFTMGYSTLAVVARRTPDAA